MKRSEFVRKGLASIAALPLTRIHARALPSNDISLAGILTGHEADWTFVGSKDWSQGADGVLYSPVFCTGECPFLLRHSSGVLIMGSRGFGIFMKTSIDDGKMWSRETPVSLCSGMMGMMEMKDGRVLVVFHEAYRTPTRIRGHYMKVAPDGILTPA